MKRILLILLPIVLFACEEGTPFENMAPDTKIFLDEIKLEGDDRLNSVVKLHWIGEDQDGYVTGYELSFDNQSWSPTARTDSTFRFDIPLGSDTTDIDFYVRAIDDKGDMDPEPAFLRVPIKNTPPTALLDTINVIPDVVYSVWSIFYTVDDLDGFETLDSSFIRLNNGPWYAVDRNINFLTFVPVNSDQEGVQQAKVFTGLDARLQEKLIDGVNVGGPNRLYLRNRDISGSFSELDSTKEFSLRKRNSDLLVIDAHGANAANTVYFPILDQVYPGYDYLDLQTEIPPFWAPTFGFILSEYDKVFWYSDGDDNLLQSQQLLMEISANQIQTYLNDGGKLLMSARLPVSFNDPAQKGSSLVFAFTPMDSLSSSSGQARIARDAKVFPTAAFAEYDTLVASGFIAGVDAFYPKDPANAMFEGELLAVSGWVGPPTIIAKSLFTNGQTNQVFVGVELHRLNQDLPALESFFDRVLNIEFNW
ncbi:MAG: hypothetical protein R8P61_22050 [Bacteroidia bacterium]|nr:hypothetical protein [Bacteroidia bacterium]